MDLRDILKSLHTAAKTFKGGTQIVSRPTWYAMQVEMFDELVKLAIRKGATPFEITRAFEGEFIGSSF